MEAGYFGRLGRSKIFFGQVGRQMYDVREVEKFRRLWRSRNLGGLEGLRGRNHRKNPLAGNKCIFASSCILSVIIQVITAQEDLPLALLLFFMFKYVLI
jgi:hypothetical protein